MILLDLTNDQLQIKDLSNLYSFLKNIAQLEGNELNIEGAICVDKNHVFISTWQWTK